MTVDQWIEVSKMHLYILTYALYTVAQKKGTNERAYEYEIPVAFLFSAVTISKPLQK
jgi:hypothetical protein